MIKNKNGNTVATYPLILFISIMCIIIIGVFFINAIFPFIWYQKLNLIVQKYMFVVEKFGYLTNEESNNLINELKDQGFDISKIKIDAPTSSSSYGELIRLKVSYIYEYKNVNIQNGIIGIKTNSIDMVVSKNSYSKI